MDDPKHKVKSQMDRKYEEDLERARALSLESLALEKFKLRKQQIELERLQETQKQRQQNSLSKDRHSETNARQIVLPQTSNINTQERLELKSRPRPGSFSSGEFLLGVLNTLILGVPLTQK